MACMHARRLLCPLHATSHASFSWRGLKCYFHHTRCVSAQSVVVEEARFYDAKAGAQLSGRSAATDDSTFQRVICKSYRPNFISTNAELHSCIDEARRIHGLKHPYAHCPGPDSGMQLQLQHVLHVRTDAHTAYRSWSHHGCSIIHPSHPTHSMRDGACPPITAAAVTWSRYLAWAASKPPRSLTSGRPFTTWRSLQGHGRCSRCCAASGCTQHTPTCNSRPMIA